MSVRDAQQDPWSRLGLVMALVWLVFLAFPLIQLWTEDDHTLVWRVTGTVLVLVFAAAYAAGWVLVPDEATLSRRWTRGPLLHLGATLGIAAATALLVGPEFALGFVPYLVAVCCWMLPLWWGPILAAALALLPIGMLVWAPDYVGLAVPGLIVLVTGVVGRLSMVQGVAYDALRSDLRLAQERERVARDVHDVLGHSLTAVTVKSALAEKLVTRDPERAVAELREIQALTRSALAEIRETVSGLRMAGLLEELDSARSALTAAGMELVVEGEPADVDPRHRTVVAWVLREAVTNVLRHSGATRCTVRLRPDGVDVIDDGRGRGGRGEGNGLRGARERVRGAGGSVEIGDGPDARGTRVSVQMEAT